MLHLLINLALAVSAGTLLFIVARALPRVSEEGIKGPRSSRLMAYLEKADAFAKRISERFLRKARVVLMKLENVVGAKLTSYKKESDRNNGLKLDLEKPAEDDAAPEEKEEEKKEEPAA